MYWCSNCEKETFSKVCDTCGSVTSEEVKTTIRWCKHCNVPVIVKDSGNNDKCPECNNILNNKKFSDMRPVFPEERLLFEFITDRSIYSLADKSVWYSNSRLIIDGETEEITLGTYTSHDPNELAKYLINNHDKNLELSDSYFNKTVKKFCTVNNAWLNDFTIEACEFIKASIKANPNLVPIVSFSGGKDSTAVSDITMKALSSPSIIHLFGDTTLEFPLTYDYVQEYKKLHPKTPIKTVRSKDNSFMDICQEIGPPARLMRWCCTMFKTGPITDKLNALVGNKRVLTFYGIRKCESVSRSKYERIEGTDESIKIQKQVVASPIFFFIFIDVWLYLLCNNVLFNKSYRNGYERVGCWCCPNNTDKDQYLAKVFMSEQSKVWREYLISFAKSVGKLDAEEYIDSGNWKARQGGNNLEASNDVIIKFNNCTTEDNAKIYQLNKPLSKSFYDLFIPFGIVSKEIGRKSLYEIVVLDLKTKAQIISIVPFSQTQGRYDVKIKLTNVANTSKLFSKIEYQIRKYNACRQCLKCVSICANGAISISKTNGYQIDNTKCVHCLKCVDQKYLPKGCLMGKYLVTLKDS